MHKIPNTVRIFLTLARKKEYINSREYYCGIVFMDAPRTNDRSCISNRSMCYSTSRNKGTRAREAPQHNSLPADPHDTRSVCVASCFYTSTFDHGDP